MGFCFSSSPFFFLFISFLVLFLNLKLSPKVKSGSDITTLVYKGCAKQAFTDPTGLYSQAISALFQTLVSQSIKLKFYETTTGTAQTTINGLFQCRRDLTNNDCYNCVSQLPTLSDKLCGSKTIPSRIQLHGCYMLYEVAGLHRFQACRRCSKLAAADLVVVVVPLTVVEMYLKKKRDTAFSFLENGVVSNHEFYATNFVPFVLEFKQRVGH